MDKSTWKKLMMSTSILFTTLIACFLFGLMISYFSSSSCASPIYAKWHYRLIKLDVQHAPEDVLDKYGKDGWEIAKIKTYYKQNGGSYAGSSWSSTSTQFLIILKKQY